jgi:RNA polymerase sigma-70 factor (ECF subfamily)
MPRGHRHAWRGRLTPLALLEGERNATGKTSIPEIPDHRLNLMFICAHPALGSQRRAPLMQQPVLGIDAQNGRAFPISPGRQGHRRTRARTRIETARIGSALPEGAGAARADAA